MFDNHTAINTIQKVTGFVFPVGNGAVGKSSLPFALENEQNQDKNIAKSMNIEFGYVTDTLMQENQWYQVMQQFLIPPGQKENEGINGNRSYEKTIDTYRFLIKKIDVILLSFNLTDIESFNDLEFWIIQALALSNPETQFIVVGTHLDMEQSRQVTSQMIYNGVRYLRDIIQQTLPDWNGTIETHEVSNKNGQNMDVLRNAISTKILLSRKIIS